MNPLQPVQRHNPKNPLIPSAARNLGILLAAALLLATTTAHAQGCAQCLDSTATTPPSVQAAYRHAILLLASTAATLFITATLLLRRHR
ncbi:MAG: copper resistance protein CopC [Acidobacteriota bacterium]